MSTTPSSFSSIAAGLSLAVSALLFGCGDKDSVVGVSGAGTSASGKIAFVSGRDGNSEIYVMNADGSGQTNLTNDAGSDSRPAWRP